MKQTSVSEQGAGLRDLGVVAPPVGKIFNVTVAYHDPHTYTWATEVYERVRRVAGENPVRATWWKISDLAEPGVLAGAVSTAMRADVIVVAIDGEERLSLPFNVWVDTWLPNRLQGAGCLVALIGRREQANGQTNKAREYLRAVARAGCFEFLVEERRLPTEPALLFRQPVRPSRPNLYPVHVRALVGIGCGVRHRAA